MTTSTAWRFFYIGPIVCLFTLPGSHITNVVEELYRLVSTKLRIQKQSQGPVGTSSISLKSFAMSKLLLLVLIHFTYVTKEITTDHSIQFRVHFWSSHASFKMLVCPYTCTNFHKRNCHQVY